MALVSSPNPADVTEKVTNGTGTEIDTISTPTALQLQLPSCSAVDVENLTFSYKRDGLNLDNINMHVPRGTIYGLLGPSGCGKTTLLRCIVGRLKPRCGGVAVFGYRPGTQECGIPGPNIGYMPQEISLISQFTVRETLEYYAGFARQTSQMQSLESRIEFLLKLLDIAEFENCYTDRLSGGQQRRVSLAVAMINEPPLLILDEPTVGVDPIVRESIWSYLVDQSKNGLTVIVTTHYIEEAGSADKVGFMRQGRILAEGNPNYLMLQHNVISMERLFLKLSQQDDFRFHQPINHLSLKKDENDDNLKDNKNKSMDAKYPSDIMLQLEANDLKKQNHYNNHNHLNYNNNHQQHLNHNNHNNNNYLRNGSILKKNQKMAAQSSPQTNEPAISVQYLNGTAKAAFLPENVGTSVTSSIKKKTASPFLTSLVPPSQVPTSNKKQQQQQQNEHYKKLDPDSLIEVNFTGTSSNSSTSSTPSPQPPHCKYTNDFLNNNDTNSDSPLFINTKYMDPLKTSSTSSSSSSSSSSAKSNSTATTVTTTTTPKANDNKKLRTYSVHGHTRSVNSVQKIGVLCKKHRIRLFRRVPELVITMLLPALEVALFCLCMGRDPTSVQMAVCNQENPPFLSLMFLKSIDSDFIALKYYKTPEEAIDSVRNADTYSAIVLAKNFSQVLKNFGGIGGGIGTGTRLPLPIPLQPNQFGTQSFSTSTKATTTMAPSPLSSLPSTKISKLVTNTNEPAVPLMTPFIAPSQPTQSMLKEGNSRRMVRRSIPDMLSTQVVDDGSMTMTSMAPIDDDESIIRIYYDGSNALHVNIIRREVFGALFRFVENAGKIFGGQMSSYKLPIKFEKPIYGGEKTDMVEFVGPGLMVFIVFFATMSITSMAFLSERREGTLERSMIVGMTPTEFIIAQIINITFLLIVQITLTVVMGFWIFDFPMKGSYVLAIAMMFLQGLCGMTFGLMLSAICTSEMTALALGAGSQLMFCFITGIFWPVETMIALLRYISYAMPQTKPMESFRHILIRGFDLSKPAVLNGYIITVAWIGFFLLVAIVIFRVR